MPSSFKCPGCAANLSFDADQQMMTCEFCGAEIAPDDLISKPDENPGDASNAASDQVSSTQEDIQVISEEEREEFEDQSQEEYFDEDASQQYICNSCGAEVVTDTNTAATFCAFCGSPTIITERVGNVRKPDYVIPFKYGKDRAIEQFFKWCKAGRFTPMDFVKDSNIEKITGLYVPFWLHNCKGAMDYKADARTVSVVTTGRKTVTTTRYYNVVRNRELFWKLVPLDASKDVDDYLMEVVEPFHFDHLVPFDMIYLAGFFADKYDQTSAEVKQRLDARLTNYMDVLFKSTTKQYSKVYNVKKNTDITTPSVKYALLPIWFLSYTYLGKKYTFAMNGQTGKIAGEPPISIVKLLILLIALLPIAAALVRILIGGLVLGGFF